MTTMTASSIEARLERIEKSLEKLSSGVQQAPVMLSMATDSLDEILGQARDQGIHLEGRLRDGLHLLKRLSDPEINKNLNNLIDTLGQAPGLVSMFVDIADEAAGQANSGPIKLNDRIDGLKILLGKLSHPETTANLEKLLVLSNQIPGLIAMGIDTFDDISRQSPLLDPKNIAFLKAGGESLQQAIAEPAPKVGGIFSLLRILKDEDRQKSLGFIMNFLKKLGSKL